MTDSAVSVRGLTKRYGDVLAVDDVSFDIEPGTVVGLLGPNGAGKTTTIKMALGLVIPTAGGATVRGVDVHRQPRAAYRHVSAMLEGARNVYWRLTVRENLAYFASLGGSDPDAGRREALLDGLGLADRADQPVNELSRGFKQKVALACVLVRDTPVVFLDEPTLGLDVESSLDLRDELRRLAEHESRTVVLSSHDMAVVEDVCDRVVIMSDGAVIADDPVDRLKALFGTHAYRVTVEGALPAGVRAELTDDFGADSWERLGDRQRFEVALTEDGAFYEVVDILRRAEQPLVSVQSVEPDLEEVFLRVTSGGSR